MSILSKIEAFLAESKSSKELKAQWKSDSTKEVMTEAEKEEKHAEPSIAGYDDIGNSKVKSICDYIIHEIKQMGVALDKGTDKKWCTEEAGEVKAKLAELLEICAE